MQQICYFSELVHYNYQFLRSKAIFSVLLTPNGPNQYQTQDLLAIEVLILLLKRMGFLHY